MNIVSYEEMIDYLRLDSEIANDFDNATVLERLILTAEEYVRNATGFKFEVKEEIPERAKLIVKFLVSHWYENRGLMTTSPTNKINYTIEALLSQLKYSHIEEEVTDGGSV